MSVNINISDLTEQSDGIWASRDVSEITDFQASSLLPLLNDTDDLSSLNTDLINHAQGLNEELALSHLRANVLRAFDWNEQAKVLEIGCQAGAITRFLAEKNLKVDAIESSRSLAQLAALRTQEFSSTRIISEPFSQLNFESEKYDVIILTGITDYALVLTDKSGISFEQALREFLDKCKQLLSARGKIFLIADNSHGIKYSFGAVDERTLKPYVGYQCTDQSESAQTLNLSQWRKLLDQLKFEDSKEYYLFPDYRFAKVLLGHDYIASNANAFQHLEGIPSVDYFHPLDIGISEFLIYQTLTANGHLGEFANSCLFVLSNDSSERLDNPDFVHFPDYKRHQDYLAIVKKQSLDTKVKRQKLVSSDSVSQSKYKQDLQTDEYIAGIQLSTIWQRSILNDPSGNQFEQHLLAYFEFLKKLDSGVVQGMNIDAIANNIVVDDQGGYHLIDREWQHLEQKIDSTFVFYRAMIHFGLRNDSIFHQLKWIRSLFTITDFLIYCFKAIGINSKIGDLEKMRSRDTAFLNSVLKDGGEYNLSDAFGHTGADAKAITFVDCRSIDEFDYSNAEKIICQPEAGHDSQQLIFRLPAAERKVACFRFFPFQHLKSQIAGYFSIDSIMLKLIDPSNHSRTHWSLDSSNAVNQANVHPGVFYGEKNGESAFMFNNNDTFLEFELPDYDLAEDEYAQLEISFRLKQSHDYEIARHKYALVERVMNEKLALREDEFKALNKKVNKLEKELTELRASRVWRLLAAYRDTFKLSGYPPKNFIGKIGQFIKRFKRGDQNNKPS